jgi:hypothetical protein
MKVMHTKAILFLLGLIAAAAVRADVIVNNLDQLPYDYYGPIGTNSNSSDFLIGQEFTLPGGATPFHLDKITLLLRPNGISGNITVSVWNVGPGNNPTNEIAEVSSQLVASIGNVDFVPTNDILLPPGIYYVVAAPTTSADNGLVNWAYTASTNSTGTGALGSFADTSPGAWENGLTLNGVVVAYPQQMSVEATPVTATVGINPAGGGAALSWPATLDGYVVETATNLASPLWETITDAPTPVAGNNVLTNTSGDPSRFFRLRQSFAADNLDQPTLGYFGPIGNDSTTNDFFIGQEFTLPAGTYTLDKVTLLLNPTNGNGSVTASIWDAGPDNNPSNQIAVLSSEMVTNVGNVDFFPTNNITLSSGTYYVVAAPTTPADNALVVWAYTLSTAWTGFGALGGYADTGPGAWENFPISAFPQQMSVQVTPSPP